MMNKLRRCFTLTHNPRKLFSMKSYKEGYTKLNKLYESLLEKHTSYNPKLPDIKDERKKLPTRQRLEHVLDDGSFFLELSQLAGEGLYGNEEVLCGGLITGVGRIKNKPTMIIANDYSQKGGSYYPITIKKQIRAQEIASELNLPCLYIVDSAGANLPRQNEVFPDRDHFGRIFYNISRMSARGIPQIAVVMGSCTAGGAYVPAMCDKSVIVDKQGTVFLGGPPLVKAATGETVTAEELGGGVTHTSISGVCDYLAKDEFDAVKKIRSIFNNLNPTFDLKSEYLDKSDIIKKRKALKNLENHFDPSLKDPLDPWMLIRALTEYNFDEFKSDYGKSIITGVGDMMGQKIGIIANNGVLFSEAALKAAHFIQLCDQQKTPLLFLQNISGFMVGKRYEWEGIAKHGAKMVNAVSNATVPKITLVFGASYGAGNYGMCGRAYSPNFMFTWPMSKLGVMGGEQAAKVMVSVKKNFNEEQKKAYFEELKEKYSKEAEAIYGTARLWDDGVIMPEYTAETLDLAFKIARNNWENKELTKSKNFGVFRM